MKSKRMQYILLSATLIIWVTVIYRFVNSVAKSDQPVHVSDPTGPEPVSVLHPDTFSIHKLKRDPFLDNEAPVYTTVITVNKNPAKDLKPVPLQKNWPVISYGGMIKNQQTNKLLAIVNVEGKTAMLNAGSVFGDVRLSKIFKDSIEVVFENQIKYVRK